MGRRLVWVEKLRHWACSECEWAFNPSNVPRGNSVDELASSFESQRDREFTAHSCAQHPRANKASAK
jgi:rubredoxin